MSSIVIIRSFGFINEDNAFNLAEKLRKIIEEYKFNQVGTKTISLGISSFKRNDTMEQLFKKADEALYCAKEKGRNRSEIYKQIC